MAPLEPSESLTQVQASIEAVWRIESPKLIASLARMCRDVGLAEELAQDALLAALEQWPAEGVPRNPGAWLMTTAKRRAIDQIRRRERFEARMPDLLQPDTVDGEFDAVLEDTIEDDLLRLIFTAC